MPAARALPARAVVDAVRDAYPLVSIVGPTAAGKSALALEIGERLGGEIVNYDSVQVYRGFDVGTGKVPREGRRGIPHHLLDFLEPNEVFTAGDFRRAAWAVLEAIRGRRKLPILVGGTGLYLRALLVGLFEGPRRSEELRARFTAMARRRGREFLHRLLRRLDPATADRVQPRDAQKIIRALEVSILARRPMSEMLRQGRAGLRGFQAFKIGLNPDRSRLCQRIDARVERMFQSGLLEETRAALARPDSARLKPLGALGYRQAAAALRGEIGLDRALSESQKATRQYAKRQMTWFRREPDVAWFAGFGDDPEVLRRVLEWLQQVLCGCVAGAQKLESRASSV